MIEPQLALHPVLVELAASVTGSEVVTAALSHEIGMVRFALQESNSGIRKNASPDDGSVVVPCTTLAAILADRPGFNPNLLKLELQGHELQALKGAEEQLHRFEIIICEMSMIPIGGVPSFAVVNRFFEEHGYQLYDVLPQYDRPLDGALWQLDAFYVRRNSPLIASTAWS